MVDALTTSAISWGLSAASWLISPVLSRLLNQCFEALGIDPFQYRNQILLDKLEKLQTTLVPQLLILTDAVQQSQYWPALRSWLQKLQSASYEAQHLLGLVEYQCLEKKVNSLFPSTSKINVKNLKSKLQIFSSEKKNLIKSLENLEKIVTEGLKFVSLLNQSSSGANNPTSRPNEQPSESISTPGSMIVGRDEDLKEIVKLLRENPSESTSNSPCYSVIGIWGIGGSGKTTLAQYVCDFEKRAKHFDCIIWAHVSKQFDVHAIWKNIWESAFGDIGSNFKSLDGLNSKLEEKLKDQMFFLVLDDVWCDKGVSLGKIEQLFAPLRAAKRGSKILVTTRIEEAAKSLGAMNPIPLRELDEDQFLSLFESYAFGNAQTRDKLLNDNLRFFGKKIAAKLRRSPLAAKTVANDLNKTRGRQVLDVWMSMVDTSIATMLNDTMKTLSLSYQHLSSPLQRCFAFCSLFPKGHLFEHDHLVNLWIAEGFIEKEYTDEHMKDTANRYISELVSCSFFQVSKSNDSHDSNRLYSMPDLIHDLAQYVSQGECFQIESGEKKEIPTQTRHLYVVPNMLGDYVKQICKLNDLCTIVVPKSSHDSRLNEDDLDALFMNSRKLHVVELPHIECLPESIMHLKNLRYLKIDQAHSIPKALNRLYQLRALCVWKRNPIPNLFEIPNVGRLILLQELREFHVRKTREFELKQLEHLKDLFGSLSIYGLHNVDNKEEARQAKLSEKKGLLSLHFYWNHESEDVLRDDDFKILDGLCPASQIKEVTIKGYSARVLPDWILENNGINNGIQLKRLELAQCRGLETLPRLRSLDIVRC